MLRRLAALTLLYLGAPLILLHVPTLAWNLWQINLRWWVIPSILTITTILLLAEHAHSPLRTREFFQLRVPAREWRRMLLRFFALAALLTAWLALKDPSRLLAFPLGAPRFWLLVMVCYPLFSVLPQGILYRWFYERHLPRLLPPTASLLLGALYFSFAHILFRNPYALLFTFIGGLCFLHTYRRTGSLLFSGIEHALFGNFLFTIGWGSYFFEGTQRLVQTIAQ